MVGFPLILLFFSFFQACLRQRDWKTQRIWFLRIQRSGDCLVCHEESEWSGDCWQNPQGGQRLYGEESDGDPVSDGGTCHRESVWILV